MKNTKEHISEINKFVVIESAENIHRLNNFFWSTTDHLLLFKSLEIMGWYFFLGGIYLDKTPKSQRIVLMHGKELLSLALKESYWVSLFFVIVYSTWKVRNRHGI